MTYDHSFFDAPISRMGTASEKWDVLRREHGARLLPMWVADMDFRCAEEIVQALLSRAAHPVYGYTEAQESLTEATLGFIQRRHGLTLTPAQQAPLPCVVTGLKAAIRALTAPGDQIIIQPPVYGPFFSSIRSNGRTLVENPLLRDAQGRYAMDFEGLEALLGQGAKMLLLCNPHNPVGRCWTREELARLARLLAQYGATLLSDEIHWDFVYENDGFCSVLALEEAQAPGANIAAVTSASKTFNLAGLQQAVLLCRNPMLLEAAVQEMRAAGVVQGNLFALVATEAAYRHGDAWLDGLTAYLTEARTLLRQEVASRLPKAVLSPLEATYLGWLDLRAYGFSSQELTRRTHAQNVAFTEGTFFGETAGEGFLRVVFACPHSQLLESLSRLERALHA